MGCDPLDEGRMIEKIVGLVLLMVGFVGVMLLVLYLFTVHKHDWQEKGRMLIWDRQIIYSTGKEYDHNFRTIVTMHCQSCHKWRQTTLQGDVTKVRLS